MIAPTLRIHEYHTSLKKGTRFVDDKLWDRIYTQAFPSLTRMVSAPYDRDEDIRSGGIDRYIRLADGDVLRVNEIVREGAWNDVLLEYLSVRELATPGWMRKSVTAFDYVAYMIQGSRRCYLLPWPTLVRAWLKNKNNWLSLARSDFGGFKIVVAKNAAASPLTRYHTESVAVPIPHIMASVEGVKAIEF